MRKDSSRIARLLLAGSLISAVPAVAEDEDKVFEVDVIPCGVSGTPDGCGSNLAASDPLESGEVEVGDDGVVKVELEGASAWTTYRIFAGNWTTNGPFQFQFLGDSQSFSIGTIRTDAEGDFEGSIRTDSGAVFAFPGLISIGQPNFVFNDPLGRTQFTTGFSATKFEVDVIRCGSPGNPDGCGSNLPASHSLRSGSVRVEDEEVVEVELKGARRHTTYQVFVGNWGAAGGFQFQFGSNAIGTVTTNSGGNFDGPIDTGSGGFVFPPGTRIGQPNFAFNAEGKTEFTTGFKIPFKVRDLFESDVVRCGPPSSPSGCGSNPAANHPLARGKVKVDNRGRIRVELESAQPNTTYRVFVGNWVNGDGFQFQFFVSSLFGSIGTILTNSKGNFTGAIRRDGGGDFVFPAGTNIGQLNFAFNDAAQTQFTTGINIPAIVP